MADGSGRITATATTSHSSSSAGGSINEQLSKKTSIFGLHLGVVVGICVGAAFVLLLFLFSICCLSCRSRKNRRRRAAHKAKPSSGSARHMLAPAREPTFAIEGDSSSKEIRPEIHRPLADSSVAPNSPPPEIDKTPAGLGKIHVDIGNNKEHRITVLPDRVGASSNSHGSGESRSAEQASPVPGPEVSHLGWGHWYTLRELEIATNGFDHENVIGEGGYGIVYRGVLEDRAQIAVKNLLNNR